MLILDKLNHIRFGCGYFSLEDQVIIHIHGSDSASYLAGQLTTNIKNMEDNSFHVSCILDTSGRYVSHFILLKLSASKFDLIINKDALSPTLDRLNQFLVSEDVDFFVDNSKDYYAIFGILNLTQNGYQGTLFNESCLIVSHKPDKLEPISAEELKIMQFASGYPEYGKEIKEQELITNSTLVQICISQNKGCYPGQETVSKILSNKGANLYPVCLKGKSELKNTKIQANEKANKNLMGEIRGHIHLADEFYYYALVKREYRVLGKRLTIENNEYEVHYFPLFKNDLDSKATDLYYMAIEEFKADREENAIDMLKKVIMIKPDFEDAYETLGVIYGRVGEFSKAIELMEKLTELNPKSVMAHTNLSLYFMKVGDKQKAEDHKAEATLKQFELLGDEANKKEQQKQQELEQQKELIRKESMFKQVLEIDTEDPLANYGLGEIEYQRQNYHEAERYLSKVIKADPKYSVAYLLLAKVLIESQKLTLGGEILEKGIQIATKNGDMMPANEMQSLLNNLR